MEAAAASDEQPQPVSELDEAIRQVVRRAQRFQAVSVWVGIGLVLTLLLFLSWTAIQQERKLESSCDFYRGLTSIPITVGPTGQASKLAVQIVSGARETFIGQGCPGALPPPSASFVHWAHFYGYPVFPD